ncbi:hypothetical protein [Burkholderia vietnamiensis]|uniref:hypothetical protein n=1 Tax=Burkholderia vietnamiensis TaxID=60552 RepID=UPI001B9C3C3B|nr:hypothetical protein [Burkholderia vietnamiensis]MBR8030774.1 hypothetical protein [Burkholderia vietnamiensis]
MTLKFKGCESIDSHGGGFRIVGDGDASFEDCKAIRSEGDGWTVISTEALAALNELGLPVGTDPKEVAGFLQEVANESQETRELVVQRSSLGERLLTLGANAPALLANLATIAVEPHVQALITRLLS